MEQEKEILNQSTLLLENTMSEKKKKVQDLSD
jgi:hypothetical protein